MDELSFLHNIPGIGYINAQINDSDFMIFILNKLLSNHPMLDICRVFRFPIFIEMYPKSELLYLITIDCERSLQIIAYIFISDNTSIQIGNVLQFLKSCFQAEGIHFPNYIFVDDLKQVISLQSCMPKAKIALSKDGILSSVSPTSEIFLSLKYYFVGIKSKSQCLCEIGSFLNSTMEFILNILQEKDPFLELRENFKESILFSYHVLSQDSIMEGYSKLFQKSYSKLGNILLLLINRMKQGIAQLLKNGQYSNIVETRKQYLIDNWILSKDTADNLGNTIINDLWLQYICYSNNMKCEIRWPMISFLNDFSHLKQSTFLLNKSHFPPQCLKFIIPNCSNISAFLSNELIIPENLNRKSLRPFIREIIKPLNKNDMKTKEFKDKWLAFVTDISKLQKIGGCPDSHPAKNVKQ